MNNVILAAKLSTETLIAVGAVGGFMVIAIAYSDWRRALKAALVIALFEGAIRKWILPGAQELVYFLKDAVLLGAYLRFFFSGDPDRKRYSIKAPATLITFLCVITGFAALNPNIGSVILGIYALKIYFFYIPVAFMMPYLFRTMDELKNSLFWYAMLATPICLLGALQYASPGNSILNTYSNDMQGMDATTFGLDAIASRVRITGTFSYITGHTTFVSFFLTLHFALLINEWPKWKFLALAANVPLLVGNGFMGGSRASLMSAGFAIGVLVALSAVYEVGDKKGRMLGFIAVGVISIFGALYYFKDAASMWTIRYNSTGGGSEVKERVLSMPIRFLEHASKEANVFGYGMAMTHPALEQLRNRLKVRTPAKIPIVYDSEIAQVLLEVGMLGFMTWYGARMLVLISSFSIAFSPLFRPGVLKSVSVAFAALQLPYLLMSVVLNHTAHLFVWAVYGLTLTATIHPTVTRRVMQRAQMQPT